MANVNLGEKLIPAPLNQRDPRWAREKLGFSSSTLGAYGCLITSFGMLADKTPPEMNNMFKAKNLFVQKNLAGTFDIIKAGAIGVSKPEYLGRFNNPVPSEVMEKLRSHLRKSNGFAIFEVDISKSPGLQQHFVVGVGVDEAGKIVINDPWMGDTATLSPRYGRTDAIAIYRIWLYTRD